MKIKYYIFLLFIITNISVFAQNSYDEIKKNLIKNYQTMDMFEMLNQCSDLLSMNEELMDGYVFLLWNDIQSNSITKANQKIEKIKSGKLSPDVELIYNDLIKKIDVQKRLSQIKDQAQSYLTSGDTLTYYKELYENAIKNNITPEGFVYVFQYINYLIDRDEYRKALIAIESINTYPDYETKSQYLKIAAKLKSNKKIEAELNYEEYARKGREFMAQQNYTDALTWLKAAKKIRNTYSINSAIDSATELKLYQKCITYNSLDDYEEYYKTYPNGLYTTTIKNGLDDYYYNLGKTNYTNSKFYDAEKNFKYYINRFGYGNHIGDAKSYLCLTYYQLGESNYNIKSRSSYKEGKSYYQAYIKCSNNTELKSKLSKRIRRMDRKIDMWGDDDYMAFMYSFEPQALVGYTNLTLKSGPEYNMGIYLNLRKSKYVWDYDSYTIDPTGKPEGTLNDVRLNGDTARGKWLITVGFTKPIGRNTWMMFALGGERNKYYKGVDAYYSNGDFDDSYMALEESRSSTNLVLETGLIFNFAPITLKIGGSYSKPNSFQANFAIGISTDM